ncbi:MAG TPA: hypothetical protein VNW29_05690 [Candidatus Sulfotelmatobacter sp.]|jgi:hypothetical protein|nr:hypothetical protein [Candidatus Sulfotelmatobacter sp.]
MTIQKARELLGEEAKSLSDEEIMRFNAETQKMCKALLSIIIANIRTKTKIELT